MTTSDDTLTTGLALLGGGVAGYAAGRFLLSRLLDERERATAPTAAPIAVAPIAALPPMTLIDPYPEPTPPPTPAPQPAPKPKPKPKPTPAPATHETTHAEGPITSPSQVDPGPVTSPSQVDPSVVVSAAPIDPYPATATGTVTPVTATTGSRSKTPLSRDYDQIFDAYRNAIPREYLRALATRESGMNPAEQSGPAWGLMQIVEVVRRDYNKAHKTKYTRDHLLDPRVNVAMGCWLLRTIVTSYHRNHADVKNLRADWSNRHFVELLTFGWNAGFSEKGGVGRVAHFLTARSLPVHLDNVHKHAKEAKASRHLQNAKKVAWCKGVVSLYFAERDHAQALARVA